MVASFVAVTAWAGHLPVAAVLVLSMAAFLITLWLIIAALHILRLIRQRQIDYQQPPILEQLEQPPTTPALGSYGAFLDYPGYAAKPVEPELSGSECRVEWSPKAASPQSLRFFVWNGSTHACSCTVRLVNLQRWSSEQLQFVDAFAAPPYAFEIFRRRVVPEIEQASAPVVVAKGDGFAILGIKRDDEYRRSQVGSWRMRLVVSLGERSRTQFLGFDWTGSELVAKDDNAGED